MSVDEFKNAFISFIEQDIDLTTLKDMEPVISDAPRIDPETGALLVKGYYSSQPSVTNFDLKYIYEHPNWKLAAINVNF